MSTLAIPIPDRSPQLTAADKIDLYRNMLIVHLIEQEFQALADAGLSRGSLHLAEGQEAIPAGACAALRKDDYLTMTYRGHGYAVCKGCDVGEILAEVCGRTNGICKGRGGKMHITDLEFGILGANGIVGGGVPTVVGAALSAQMSGTGQVAMTVFGDATINQGVVHESLNIAALWKLPVIFLCENNLYGEMTPFEDTSPVAKVSDRMAAYNIESVVVDGNDVLAVFGAVFNAAEKGRRGEGPTFIEAMTYRTCGHYSGDPGGYRPESEVESWRKENPIDRFEKQLIEEGIATQAVLELVMAKAKELMTAAREFALAGPHPDVNAMSEGLYL